MGINPLNTNTQNPKKQMKKTFKKVLIAIAAILTVWFD